MNVAAASLSLVGPWALYAFVRSLAAGVEESESFMIALAFAGLLGIAGAASGVVMQHYFYRMLLAHQAITNALNRALFQHSLRITLASRARATVGEIVNRMSSDTDSLAEVPNVIAEGVGSATVLVGATASLFWLLGPSAGVAVASLALLAPLTRKIARDFSRLEEEMSERRDERVTLLSQALSSIRVVKCFVWEGAIARETGRVRTLELSARRRLARAESAATVAYVATSSLVLFGALAAFAALGGHLEPAVVFAAVALFGALEEPIGNLSRVVSRATNALVGADRIARFLRSDALPDALPEALGVESVGSAPRAFEPTGVRLSSLTASLGGGEAVPGVRSVSIEVQPGQAIAIVGAVGSGKSTLVAAILGEARALEGRVTFINASGAEVARPRTAYVPQEAYLINSSLRENLLFGADSDPELHVTDETLHEAMRLAAFENDFSRLRAGLATEIGERGVNLSGGQKQRVSLARAVVFRPQLVLLDDPLSAVDVRAESTIEDRLIFGEWAQSTRVVATHRLGGLARYDRVVFLARGGVVAQGGLGELLATCPEFRAFYADHERQSAEHLEPASATPAGVRAESAGQDHRVTEDEEREIGAVKGSVYLKYLTRLAGSRPSLRPWRLALLVGGALAVTGFPFLQRAWLAWSSNLQSGNGTPVSGFESVRALAADPVTSIWVYGALCFASLGVVLANRQYWLTRGMEAGREMHDSMLEATLAAPLRFFDSTPVGRILQRFSRDVEAVDLHLQWSFESTVRCAVQVVAAIALIAVSLPVTVFAIVPTLWIYERLQRQYRRPAREAKRLDSVSRSPRYAHFKETLQGLAVIRAYGRSNWFMHEFFDRLERSQRMFRGHYMLNRWFSSRVPILGGAISFATGAALTLAARSGRMSAGEAGLVATYAIGLWDYLNWGVRIFSEVESRMTSVERIDRYASLAPEPSVTKAARTPLRASWPEVGRIEFKNATARYASDLPPALAGLSFFVKAGARVGIVGRSGSGKSTALQALFRCVELESGSIEIDGVDIATVPLARLRRAIAAIPQDPTLFIGTVRDNLDREGVCTDLAIERALDLARMRDVVASLPGGLSAPVHENGANFSQGQRQLLCLARALLSGARIVTLDEATASVDVQTDAAIQDVVRTACNGVTMLIVAHRLGTVADCDTVIEIRDGAGIERPVYAALHSGGSSPVALDRLLSTSL